MTFCQAKRSLGRSRYAGRVKRLDCMPHVACSLLLCVESQLLSRSSSSSSS
uniref:Uncharacterized protein n=1 Tax=Anopheles albimanus TaxID=7167 RepID=A0A182FXU9_ANOAL